VLLVLGACLAIAAASHTRIPLWSLLVGVAAVVGAYEEAYTASPSQFLDQSFSSVTSVLLAAAIGFLASSILGPVVAERRTQERLAAERDATDRPDDLETAVSFNEILDSRQEQTRRARDLPFSEFLARSARSP